MSEFDQQVADFREAVAAGEFTRAATLWERYMRCLESRLTASPDCAARVEEARQLLEWARCCALAVRAQAFDKWNALSVRRRYAAQAPPATSGLVRILG
jgi:hypothetical protein